MKRLLTAVLLLSTLYANDLKQEANHATHRLGDVIKCGTGWWVKHKQNFGMEKVSILFPNHPTMTHNITMTTATAWESYSCYTLTGYFPPVGNIDAQRLFQEMLGTMSHYPFSLSEHAIYENFCGNWVLEYTAQDSYRNLIIRSFTVVTPYNGYTLQCIQPFGTLERYSYFRDSFHILCGCGY